MLNFKEYITETSDKTYHVIPAYHDSDYYRYIFYTADGRRVNVSFTADPYIGLDFDEMDENIYYPLTWEVAFTVDDKLSVTGEGDAFRIFATVIKAIEIWYFSEKNIGELLFSAAREGKKPESRIRLYRTMLKKFSKKRHFDIKEEDTMEGVIFTIRRK